MSAPSMGDISYRVSSILIIRRLSLLFTGFGYYERRDRVLDCFEVCGLLSAADMCI